MVLRPVPTLQWTFEQAEAAQAESKIIGPAGPLFQWFALQKIELLKTEFESGNQFALMEAISECAVHELVLPAWVVSAYLRAYRKVIFAEVASWDEVLPHAYQKGIHLNAVRKRRRLGIQVWNKVQDLRQRYPEVSIDVACEEVGKSLGLGRTLSQEYYYAWANRLNRKNR